MRIFLFVIVFIFLVVSGLALYVYVNRQDIFDENIDKILQNQLPRYIEIGSLKVDLNEKSILIEDFKLRNPEGFQSIYLAEIDRISSGYAYVDEKNILHGISLDDIELSGARIFLERDTKGILNIERMESVLQDTRPKEKPGIKTMLLGLLSYFLGPVKSIGQLLKVEPVFRINNGMLFFKDYFVDGSGYLTTIERITGTIKLGLKKDFKGINYLSSQGRGLVNAKPGQVLAWDTTYYPTRDKLTMSNTFDIHDVDFTHFEPYYDRYSPFIFEKGKASGRLVFDFDNGQIGSDNEILFSGIVLEQKKDHSFNRFWPTGADDLYRYFSSERGDVVFDFKIKGPMDEPRFYLGSKTKRALTYMVFDKVVEQIFRRDEDAPDTDSDQPATDAPQGKRTKFEKVIDILKGL